MAVRLVYDPYGLFTGQAARVQDAGQLLKTFQEIDALLSLSEEGTQESAVYIIDSILWAHFASYKHMAEVRVEEYLPRLLVAERFRLQPPDWLTDALIFRTGFLRCGFDKLVGDKWDETLVEWLLPGGRKSERKSVV